MTASSTIELRTLEHGRRSSSPYGGFETGLDHTEVESDATVVIRRPVGDEITSAITTDIECQTPNNNASIRTHTMLSNEDDAWLEQRSGKTTEIFLAFAIKAFKPVIAISGLIIGAITLFLTFFAWQDSHFGTKLAKWTAKKEFFDRCSLEDHIGDSGCDKALKVGLPPPPVNKRGLYWRNLGQYDSSFEIKRAGNRGGIIGYSDGLFSWWKNFYHGESYEPATLHHTADKFRHRTEFDTSVLNYTLTFLWFVLIMSLALFFQHSLKHRKSRKIKST